MGKTQRLDFASSGSNRVPLLNNKEANNGDGPVTDLEHGDAVQAANVGYCRILSLAKPDAGKIVIATIALLIASTTSLLIPKFGGTIVPREIRTPEQQAEAWEAVKNIILEILIIVVVGSLCTALRAWLFSSASERVVARLRKNLFAHLIHQEIAFYDVTRTGELLSRLSEDTQIIKNAATTNLSEALRNVTTAFIGIGFMFSSSWKLTFIFPASLSVGFGGCTCYFGCCKEVRTLSPRTFTRNASIAEESFGAIRTVRSFAQEGHTISNYSEKVDETLKLGLRQARVVGLFFGGLNAASMLSVVVVVIYGAYLTITGSLTAGALTSFILYSLTVGSSISSLSGLYTTAMKAAGASRRAFQLLDRVSAMPQAGRANTIQTISTVWIRFRFWSGGAVPTTSIWFTLTLVARYITPFFSTFSRMVLTSGPKHSGNVGAVLHQPLQLQILRNETGLLSATNAAIGGVAPHKNHCSAAVCIDQDYGRHEHHRGNHYCWRMT